MIVHPQVDPPAAPAESALLGVPNWLVPTVGKAITAATVVAMFYLQAAQSRDERLGLAHSDQLGPPNKLREILSLAGRPPPDLHEAIAALMGDPRPNQTAAAPSSSIDLRDLLAQVQALLGGAIAPGAGAGAPAAPTPPTVAGAAGGSSPSAAASWPSMPWHAPASAPPSPTPPPASATPPAANTRPPTRLPAGFVSTDHLPRYRPEFTREGSIKRLAAAAPPTTPTSPTASPSPSPATQPAPPPATAPATAVSKAPDQSASPALLKVVRRALEASTTRLDALAARVDAIEARLAAHEARSERATDTAPSTEARHDDPPCAPPAEGDAHAPAASSSATSPSTTPSPSPSPSTFAAADGHAFAHVLAPLLADASSEELHQALLLVAQHNATTGQRTLDLAARIGAVEAICGYVERGAHPDTPSAAPDEPEAPKRQAHRR